ncbi:MAG: hypothetical protein R3282_01270 [Rhodothermales bacterium]|nr:hypothetical protein [Rhodothermales bacterium]
MRNVIVIIVAAAATAIASTFPYPLDGFEYTGIRRLLRTQSIAQGKLPGRKPPPGALKSLGEISLTLPSQASEPLSELPAVDPALNAKLARLFPGRDASYSVAMLDITPGRPQRLALHKETNRYQPGSVGKLAILAGLFTELKSLFPDDTNARRELLKSRMVTAGPWVRSNHHTIPVFDPASGRFASRAVIESDTFSLYEWADHAISASSNAAASVLWKEVVLMRALGSDYPPSAEAERQFFASTPKSTLGEIAISVVNDPLRAMGIPEDDWRLGSLFTNYASSAIPAPGGSWGNPRGLLVFLLRIEEGKAVDPWSSLEIKRLMYATERRIRYAASPALADAALYFKSGSLYKCKKEPGEDCGKYRGNVYNYMNSVATIEAPDGHVYLVALMSNVLQKNSASEHLAIASQVHRIITE